MFYLYTLIDPRNGECFYVGKGTKNRYKDHLAYRHSNYRVRSRIKDIREFGQEPIVDVGQYDEDEHTVLAAEALFQKWFDPPCNIAPCGPTEGYIGVLPKTEEHKRKIGLAHKGKPKSLLARQRMSSAQRRLRAEGKITSTPPDNTGRTYSMRLVQCPHCGTEGKGGNMTRYHFDKCKKRREINELS